VNSKDIFLKHLAPTSHNPLAIEVKSADGSVITDVTGKTYYDLIAGIGVTSVGHNNPLVKQAIIDQLNLHAHVMVYGEYIQKSVNQLAERLAKLLPPGLSTSYLVNSGTEANEGAVKLAKRITGKHKMVAFKKGYHGNTQGSMSVSSNEAKKQPFRPLIPGTRFIEFNNINQLTAIDKNVAGVIVEPIQGDAGVIIPTQAFMTELRRKCDESGAMLIFDEVQTGIGRTGKMFAFEHFNIIPDILTLAKGLGGGLPIGTFISSFNNMQLLASDPMLGHITTFGGNPVSCASANTVLDIVSAPAFLEDVERKGLLLEELLRHQEVIAIRRKGLMLAIELKSEAKVDQVIKLALEEGVIIYWFLSTRNSFRISPPLTISENELKKSCEILLGVFDQL